MKFFFFILITALLMQPPGHAGHIEVRLSVKYFAATPDPAVFTSATNAVTNANRVMDLQMRGTRFVLQEVVRLNPSVALPTRRYYSSANPNDFVTLSLVSWRQWWLDADPSVGCDQAPAEFSGVSRSTTPPFDLTIKPGDELSEMWREGICANKTAFSYRTNACNIYLLWPGLCAGAGSFPNPSDCSDNLFYVSSLDDRSLFLHEWGHWASLQHPFAGTEGTFDAVGNDDIADTPVDAHSVTPLLPPIFGGAYLTFINSVSQALYGTDSPPLSDPQWAQLLTMGKIAQIRWISGNSWVALNAAQQAELRLTWQNIMSYHKGAPPEEQWLFTEGQLDKVADSMMSFSTRSPTATGRYWFFGGPTTDNAAPLGSSKRSFTNITAATVNNASLASGDIVLGRPGSYPVPGPPGTSLRINKPCTIRATRGGNVPGLPAGAFSIYGN
jgi:hypothetical protein